MSTQVSEKEKVKWLDFYEIEWLDFQSCAEYKTFQEVNDWVSKDCLIVDRGWIICENKKYIVVCSQISEDGDFGNKTKIFKSLIKNKKKLNVKEIK